MKSITLSLGKIVNFIFSTLPRIITFLGLNFFFIYTAHHYYNNGRFEDLWGIYLSTIGICSALASILFSYTETFNDDTKGKIRTIGESFLFGTINLILAMIIFWVAFVLKEYVEYKFVDYISLFIFTLAFGMINFAAVSLDYGIQRTYLMILPRFYSDFDWIDRRDF